MDIWYYGARWERGCHPDDLWTKYFTSSDYVAIQRWLYGEPDVIEVRKTFQTKEEAKEWEEKVLRRMNAVKNKCWLNQQNAGKKFYFQGHSEETIKKIKDALRGIPHSKEWNQKVSDSQKRNL